MSSKSKYVPQIVAWTVTKMSYMSHLRYLQTSRYCYHTNILYTISGPLVSLDPRVFLMVTTFQPLEALDTNLTLQTLTKTLSTTINNPGKKYNCCFAILECV